MYVCIRIQFWNGEPDSCFHKKEVGEVATYFKYFPEVGLLVCIKKKQNISFLAKEELCLEA
jgi:hypothetical protein